MNGNCFFDFFRLKIKNRIQITVHTLTAAAMPSNWCFCYALGSYASIGYAPVGYARYDKLPSMSTERRPQWAALISQLI